MDARRFKRRSTGRRAEDRAARAQSRHVATIASTVDAAATGGRHDPSFIAQLIAGSGDRELGAPVTSPREVMGAYRRVAGRSAASVRQPLRMHQIV